MKTKILSLLVLLSLLLSCGRKAPTILLTVVSAGDTTMMTLSAEKQKGGFWRVRVPAASLAKDAYIKIVPQEATATVGEEGFYLLSGGPGGMLYTLAGLAVEWPLPVRSPV